MAFTSSIWSHLNVEGINWEPVPVLIGSFIEVRSYFPIDYPRNRRPATAIADPTTILRRSQHPPP